MNDTTDGPTPSTTEAGTEPQFDAGQLLAIGVVLALMFVAAVIAILAGASSIGVMSSATGPSGAETETLRYPFAAQMARYLAVVGTGTILLGAWLQAASMRTAKASATPPMPTIGAMSLAAVGAAVKAAGSALGEAVAKLKAPVAMIVVGAVLLVMAGFVAVETIPNGAEETSSPSTTVVPSTTMDGTPTTSG